LLLRAGQKYLGADPEEIARTRQLNNVESELSDTTGRS